MKKLDLITKFPHSRGTQNLKFSRGTLNQILNGRKQLISIRVQNWNIRVQKIKY